MINRRNFGIISINVYIIGTYIEYYQTYSSSANEGSNSKKKEQIQDEKMWLLSLIVIVI